MPDKIILIAALSIDGYIARHSLETTDWSQDLPLFKKQTEGHAVVMGKNTSKILPTNLINRESIIINRNDKPGVILKKIKKDRCFIIGGGKTYYLFASYLTNLYITPHPHIFGKGVPLFNGENMKEMKLQFDCLVPVNKPKGIFQYQYSVLRE